MVNSYFRYQSSTRVLEYSIRHSIEYASSKNLDSHSPTPWAADSAAGARAALSGFGFVYI